MWYKGKDGLWVQGSTPEQVALHLWTGSFSKANNLEGYMGLAANNISVVYGFEVRSDTPENFISDLITHGLLTETTGPNS